MKSNLIIALVSTVLAGSCLAANANTGAQQKQAVLQRISSRQMSEYIAQCQMAQVSLKQCLVDLQTAVRRGQIILTGDEPVITPFKEPGQDRGGSQDEIDGTTGNSGPDYYGHENGESGFSGEYDHNGI